MTVDRQSLKHSKENAVIVPEAGHYPQSQRPDITADAVLHSLKTLDDQSARSDI
jgi:hypothetical protein